MHPTPFSPLSTQEANTELAFELYDTHADLATAADFKLLVEFCNATPRGLLLMQKMLASEAFLLEQHSKKQSPLIDYFPQLQLLLKTSIPALSAAVDLLRQAKESEDILKESIGYVIDQKWNLENCEEMNAFFGKIARAELCPAWADRFMSISPELEKHIRCKLFKNILRTFEELGADPAAYQSLFEIRLVDHVFDDDMDVFERVLEALHRNHISRGFSMDKIVLILEQLAEYLHQFENTSYGTFEIIFEIYCVFIQMVNENPSELIKARYFYFVSTSMDFLLEVAKEPSKFDFEMFYETFFAEIELFTSFEVVLIGKEFEKLIIRILETTQDYLKNIKTNDEDYSAELFVNASSVFFEFYQQLFNAKYSVFNQQYYKEEQLGRIQELMAVIFEPHFFDGFFRFINDVDPQVNELYTSCKFTEMMEDIRLENRVDLQTESFEVRCWVSLLEIYEQGCLFHFESNALIPLLRSCLSNYPSGCLAKIVDYFEQYLEVLIAENTGRDAFFREEIVCRLPLPDLAFDFKDHTFVPSSAFLNSIYLSLMHALCNQPDGIFLFLLSDDNSIESLFSIYLLSYYFKFFDIRMNRHIMARYQMHMPILFSLFSRESETICSKLSLYDDILLQLLDEDILSAIFDSKAKSACERVDFLKEDETYCWRANNLSIDRVTNLIHYENKPQQFCDFLEDLVNEEALPAYSVEALIINLVSYPWGDFKRSEAAERFFKLIPTCLLSKNLVLVVFCIELMSQPSIAGVQVEFIQEKMADHEFLNAYCKSELCELKAILNSFVMNGSRYMEDLTSQEYKLEYEIVQENQPPAQPGQLHEQEKPLKTEEFDLMPCVQVIRARMEDYVLPVCVLAGEQQEFDLITLLDAVPISSNYEFLAEGAPVTSAEYYSEEYFKSTPFEQSYIYLQHCHFLSPHAIAELSIELIGQFGAVFNETDIISDGHHVINYLELKLPLFHPIESEDSQVPGQTIQTFEDTKPVHEVKLYLGEAVKEFAVWMARQPFIYSKFIDKMLDDDRAAVLEDCEELMVMFLNGLPDDKKFNKFANEAVYNFCYLLSTMYLNGYKEFNQSIKERKRGETEQDLGNDVEIIEIVKEVLLNKDMKYVPLKEMLLLNLTKIAMSIQEEKELPIAHSVRECAQTMLADLVGCCLSNEELPIVAYYVEQLAQLISLNNLVSGQFASIQEMIIGLFDNLRADQLRLFVEEMEIGDVEFAEMVISGHDFSDSSAALYPMRLKSIFQTLEIFSYYYNNRPVSQMRTTPDRLLSVASSTSISLSLKICGYGREISEGLIKELKSLSFAEQMIALSYFLHDDLGEDAVKKLLSGENLTDLYHFIRENASGREFTQLLLVKGTEVSDTFLTCRNMQMRAICLSARLCRIESVDIILDGLAEGLFSFCDKNFYIAFASCYFIELPEIDFLKFPDANSPTEALITSIFDERKAIEHFLRLELANVEVRLPFDAVLKWKNAYERKYFAEKLPIHFEIACNIALQCTCVSTDNIEDIVSNFSGEKCDEAIHHDRLCLLAEGHGPENCSEIIELLSKDIIPFLSLRPRSLAVELIENAIVSNPSAAKFNLEAAFLCSYAVGIQIPGLVVFLHNFIENSQSKNGVYSASVLINIVNCKLDVKLYYEMLNCLIELYYGTAELCYSVPQSLILDIARNHAHLNSIEQISANLETDMAMCDFYGVPFFSAFRNLTAGEISRIEDLLQRQTYANPRERELMYAQYYVYNVVNSRVSYSTSIECCNIIDRILLAFSVNSESSSTPCYYVVLGILQNSEPKDYEQFKEDIKISTDLPDLELLLTVLQILCIRSPQEVDAEGFEQFIEFILTLIIQQTSFYMQEGRYGQAQYMTRDVLRVLCRLLQENQQLAQVKFGRCLFDFIAMSGVYFLNLFSDLIMSPNYQISDNQEQILTLSQHQSKLPKDTLFSYFNEIKAFKFDSNVQREVKELIIYAIYIYISYLTNQQRDLQESLYQDFLLLALALYDKTQSRPYYNTVSKFSQAVFQLQESEALIIPFALVQTGTQEFVLNSEESIIEPDLLRLRIEMSIYVYIQKITNHTELTVQAIQLFSKLVSHLRTSLISIVPFVEKWEFKDEYVLLELSKQESDLSPAFEFYKEYCLTLAFQEFVGAAKQIHISLNKIYVMGLLLQDYYAQDINMVKETQPGTCLYLSFLNKSDNFERESYTLQQQEETALKAIMEEIVLYGKAVLSFEQSICVMIEQSSEQHLRQAIPMLHFAYFIIFTAPKPLVDVTKVINEKVDLYTSMFYKMHHSLAKLLLMHYNALTQNAEPTEYASFDVEEVARVALAAVEQCLSQHEPAPYLKEEFEERMLEFEQRFEELSLSEVPVTEIEIRCFDNGIFRMQTAKLFGKIDIQPDAFLQESCDALYFKNEYPYYCIENSAVLTLELIRIAGFLRQEVFKKVVLVSERLYSAPLSSIAFYKYDKRCDFENRVDAMCIGDKQNCIFLGLNVNFGISQKAVDYLISELYMKIYEQYFKQIIMQAPNEQMQAKYEQMWPRIITDETAPGYFSQFSSIKGVNLIYELIEMIHNVQLPGIKQYPHQYSQIRFSYIQLFVLQLLRLTAEWGDKYEENEYGYGYMQIQRVFFRVTNLSSDFASSVYTGLMQGIFNFESMRSNTVKPIELVGCTHDLEMHFFFYKNQSIASIERLMIQLLLLLPLNSTLLRSNLSDVLLRTLNACYTFPMDIHTLLLLSETFEQEPFHSELVKLNQIIVNYVHANTKRDTSKKYSFRVSHHEPAISPLHQAHFEAAFDNSGFDCLNLLEKLFAAGIPHFDSARGGQNHSEKRLEQQKEELGQIIDLLFKSQQLLNSCGAQTAEIDEGQVLLINQFKTKNSTAYADFFTTEAIAAGSLTALSYECAAMTTIHLTLIFEAILQKMGVRGTSTPGGPEAIEALEEYRKADTDKEKLIQTNKQSVEDVIRERESVEKEVLELEHSRDNTARQLEELSQQDTTSDTYQQLRQKFIDLDSRLSEISRRQAEFKPNEQELQDERDELNQDKFLNIITLIDRLSDIMQAEQENQAQPEVEEVFELCQMFKRLRESVEDFFKFDPDEQIVTTSLISTEKIGQRILSEMYEDLGAKDVAFGVNYPVQYKFTTTGQFFAFSWFTNRRMFELNAQFRHGEQSREKTFQEFKRYMLSCDQSDLPAVTGRPVMIRNRPSLFYFGFEADMMMYEFEHNLYKAQPSYDYWQEQFEHITGLYVDSLSHLSQSKPKEKPPAVKDVNIQMNDQLKKNLRSEFKQIIGKISESQDRNQLIYQLFLKELNIFSQDASSQNTKLDAYRTELVLYEKDCFSVQEVHTELANLLESENYGDLDNLSQELREEYLKKTTTNDKQHTAFVNQTELYEKLYDFLTRFAREIRQDTPEIDFSSLIQQICSQKLENRQESLVPQPPPDSNLIELNNLNQYFQCQTIALINSIVPGPICELFNMYQNGTAIFSSVLNIIASDQKEELYTSPELDFDIIFDSSLMRKIVEAYAIFAALYPDVAIETVFKQGILRRGVGETIVRARQIQVGERNRLNCGDIQIYEILIFFLIERFTPSSIAPGPSVLFFEQSDVNMEEEEQLQQPLKQEIIKDLEYINYDDYKAKYMDLSLYILEELKFAIHQDVDRALIPELEFTYQCDAAMLSYQPQIIAHLLCFALLSPVENAAVVQRLVFLLRDFVLQAYGRSMERGLDLIIMQFHDIQAERAVITQIRAVAMETVQMLHNKSEGELEALVQTVSERIFEMVAAFLQMANKRTAEHKMPSRQLSTLAYTRLLVLNAVESVLAAPYPYLSLNVGEGDTELEEKTEQLAERLWVAVRFKLQAIRFHTITNLASHLLYEEGDPISAYKMGHDEIIRAYVAGNIYCIDEQSREEKARRVAIHEIQMLERLRNNIISLIQAGSLSIAREQLQTFENAIANGMIINNERIQAEFEFLHAFVYELLIDIGEISYTAHGQDLIRKVFSELSTESSGIVLERHYYGCVITFEEGIDTYIREESPKFALGEIAQQEYQIDLLELTSNVINALLNMVSFSPFTPTTDTDKQFLIECFADIHSRAAIDSFGRLLTYFSTPPQYMLEVIEEDAVKEKLKQLNLPIASTLCDAFAEHFANSCNNVASHLIYEFKERLAIELLCGTQRHALRVKFVIAALFERVFKTDNSCRFEYHKRPYCLSGDDISAAQQLYLYLKAVCEIPLSVSVDEEIQTLFGTKEPNFAELQQVSVLSELEGFSRAAAQDSSKKVIYEVHKLFYDVLRGNLKHTTILLKCDDILRTGSTVLVHTLIGYYLALFVLHSGVEFETSAMETQRLLSSVQPGPAPWTIAVVGYLIQKYESGERPIQAEEHDYENLLLNLMEFKHIYEIASRMQGRPVLDALRELQSELFEGVKEFNKSVVENSLYVVVDKENARVAARLHAGSPEGQFSIISEQDKFPAGISAKNRLCDSPYFAENVQMRIFEAINDCTPCKINYTSVRVIFIDGLPFVQARLLPSGETILLFNGSGRGPMLQYAKEVLPNFSNLRISHLQRFWQERCGGAMYQIISFGPCCYAFVFVQKAEFTLIERLNNQHFNFNLARVYKFKRALASQLARFMMMAEEYFFTVYNLAELSVDLNSGAILPFIIPVESLGTEEDYENAAVHSFYLYDALTNHVGDISNPMHLKYEAHRRPRTSIPKEFVAFAQPHFVIGVLPAEAVIQVKKDTVKYVNTHIYPYQCIGLDLAQVAPQNMSTDQLGLAQAQMFLDETALCSLQKESYTRETIAEMCNMRCAQSQAIVQGIETQETKKKVKATNIDSLAQQCSQMKTAMPAAVEWVVACMAADYD